MIAVITGDIINSENIPANTWLEPLKILLTNWGEYPSAWDVYRGDEFQIKCHIKEAFLLSLSIKSLIKSNDGLDVRMAMGIGTETFTSEKITESNGSAYVNSGRLLNDIKSKGKTLAIKTPNDVINHDLNLVLKWSCLDFDSWTSAVAEIIHLLITHENITQEEIAQKLGITQSSVSQRMKRSNYELILETHQYFQEKLKQLL